jgi:CheY-like chemotaxis protein
MMAAGLRLWIIDDTIEHHAVLRATLADFPTVSHEGFLDAGSALRRYSELKDRDPAQLPAVVLMDYYLGSQRGDRVTRLLRQLQPPEQALIIIGYSSVASCSERIVAAGGSLVLRKTSDKRGCNPHLARYLRQLLAL